MANPVPRSLDPVVEEIVEIYGQSKSSPSIAELAKKFASGAWSYPYDISLALVLSVAAQGAMGGNMQRKAREIHMVLDTVMSHVVTNSQTLWYILNQYANYLKSSGRWRAQLSSSAGRLTGSQLFNMGISRLQRSMKIDPKRDVSKPGKFIAATSIFLLAGYGAACRAIIEGERSFASLLHTILTGEVDPGINNALKLDFRYNAAWRDEIPADAAMQVAEIRHFLEGIRKFMS